MQEIRLCDKRGEFIEAIFGNPMALQVGDIIKSVQSPAAMNRTYVIVDRIWDLNLKPDERFKLIVEY
jgi:hypothetical protein